MSLVGFMQAGSTSVYAGSWRHPATEHGFLTAGYYQKIGRTLDARTWALVRWSSLRFLEASLALFERRVAEGRIRDGHGERVAVEEEAVLLLALLQPQLRLLASADVRPGPDHLDRLPRPEHELERQHD